MSHGLKKTIISLFGMQGVNYLVPLLTLPYLTRVLGVHFYGQLGFSLAIVQYFVLFTNFGFDLTSSKRIAQNKDDLVEVSRIYWQTTVCKIVLAIISLCFLALLVLLVPKFYEVRYLIFIMMCQIVANVLLPIWFFQGLEMMSNFALINSCIKLLSVPLIFLLVKTPSDVYWAAIIQSAIPLLAGVFSVYLIYKRSLVQKVKIYWTDIKKTVKESAIAFTGYVAIFVYTMSSSIVLGLMSTYDQVGIYSAADKIKTAILGVFLVLGSAFYPRVNVLLKESENKAFLFLKKLIFIQGGASIVIAIIFYFAVDFAVPIIFGSGYEETALILKIMTPMILLIPMSVIFCNYVLLSFGHLSIYAKISILVAFIHLTYVFVLSKYYGAVGVAVSMLITEVVSYSIAFFMTWRKGYLFKIFFAKT